MLRIAQYWMICTFSVPFWLGLLFILCACSRLQPQSVFTQIDKSIYFTDRIDDSHIQYIWLELPYPIEHGLQEVRLFIARSDPSEPVIPNLNELKCRFSSAEEFEVLKPENVLFDFMQDGTFTGNFTYEACPECVECYMNWDYKLEMNGVISGEVLKFDIKVSHIGHNVQGSYLSTELYLMKGDVLEPNIHCNQAGVCSDIQMVNPRGIIPK